MRLALLCLFWASAIRAGEPLQILDIVETSAPQAAADSATRSLQYLLERLPTPYQLIKINRSRAHQWAKTNSYACIPWLRRTPEREQDFLFSLPYLIESPLQLVVRADSPLDQHLLKLVDAEGRVSLRQLMAMQDFPRLGVEQKRSYGQQLDLLMAELAQQQRLLLRNVPPERVGYGLHMLEKNFIDATLEYPKVVKLSGLPLHSWPLQEAEAYTPVYFACSKTPAGASAIATINQVIQTAAGQQIYQQLALGSLDSATHQHALLYWQQMLADNNR